ncbi:WD repeat-containing and planar cell polarity effector protein fritz-like protein, partial [Larimichthys crocea]
TRVTLLRQMAFCLAELHLWSTKSSLQVKDTDIGTYQYYDKGEPARGYSWTPKNRRPEKLRDSLKELEVMLSSGVLVTLTLNGPQLEQVYIDRTLVGRLPANTVTDAVLSDRLILLSFLEQSQVAAVYLNQKNQDSPETGRRTDKLSPCEIKVVCVDMSGRGRRLHRRVGLNRLQDVALCWWDLDEPDARCEIKRAVYVRAVAGIKRRAHIGRRQLLQSLQAHIYVPFVQFAICRTKPIF